MRRCPPLPLPLAPPHSNTFPCRPLPPEQDKQGEPKRTWARGKGNTRGGTRAGRTADAQTIAHKSVLESANPGLGVCIWMHPVNSMGSSLSLGQPTPE